MATDLQRTKVLESLKSYKRRYMKKEFGELDESATRIMINAFLTEVLGYKELNEIKNRICYQGCVCRLRSTAPAEEAICGGGKIHTA